MLCQHHSSPPCKKRKEGAPSALVISARSKPWEPRLVALPSPCDPGSLAGHWICPIRSWWEPFISSRTEYRDKAVTFFSRVVEQDAVVGTIHRDRQIPEASRITPSDIALWDVMAARENAISDSSKVDLNALRPDVDKHDLVTTNSGVNHQLQVVLSGQRRLNGEALASACMFFCGF